MKTQEFRLRFFNKNGWAPGLPHTVRNLIFCMICAASHLPAQPLVNLPYSDFPKNIDGLRDDWPENPTLDMTVENEHEQDTSYDNGARIFLAWDEQNLYGFLQISDQRLIQLRRGDNLPTLNLNDAAELYIDPLFDSKKTMDVNDYQFIMDVGNNVAILKGDKYLIADEWRAPKDVGSATIAFQHKSIINGTLNDPRDRDRGWQIEFALPWAALGVVPAQNHRFRMDLCVDDMDELMNLDTVPENAVIAAYTYKSWTGSRDFSFPSRWMDCRLTGSPSPILAFGKKHGEFWLPFAALMLISALVLIFVLLRKVNRLKNVPVREDLKKSLMAPWVDDHAPESESPNQALFAQLRAYILANLHQDLSPEDLARQALVSLRHMQRIFREEMECTPNQFILMIKMEQAPLLLRQNNRQVAETAYALGFSDPGYFSKVFRKYHGVAPRDHA